MSLSDRALSSRRSAARVTLSNGRYGSSTSFATSNGAEPGLPLSENVRRLQESLQLLFSDRDRVAIIQILEDFHHDRDVPLFAENLRAYIDSPIKEKHFLPRLRRVFPRAELAELDRLLMDFGLVCVSDSTSSGVESAAESRHSFSTAPVPHGGSTRSVFEPDPSDMAPISLGSNRPQLSQFSWVDLHGRPVSPPPQGTLSYRSSSARPDLLSMTLCVPASCSLGLSIRGGSEFGLGVFVAKVDPDSVAANAGILPGDQVLRLNGIDFQLISHEEAVRLLHRFAPRMELALRRVGRLPVARAASNAASLKTSSAKSGGRSLARYPSSKRARSVGPPTTASTIASSATLPRQAPFDQFQLYSCRSDVNLRSTEGPLEELSPTQRETLAYYLDEYREGHVSVDSFVLALSQLTEGGGRAAFEELARLVGGWVRPGDQSRYTLLTSLNQELTALRLRKEQGDLTPQERSLGHEEGSLSVEDEAIPKEESSTVVCTTTPLLTASECHPRSNGATLPQRSASAATEVRISRAIRDIDETGVSDDSGVGSGRQRGNTTQETSPPSLQDAAVCTEPRQSRDAGTLTEDGSGMPFKKKTKVLVDRSVSASLGMSVEGGAGSRQPLPRIINVQLPMEGKLVITSPSGEPAAIVRGPHSEHVIVESVGGPSKHDKLGIAVQGGCDVPDIPLPQIVRLEPGGAAAAAGRLRVGQTILEVNGVSLQGVPHQEAAQMIARAFRNPDVQTMELLVIEPAGQGLS